MKIFAIRNKKLESSRFNNGQKCLTGTPISKSEHDQVCFKGAESALKRVSMDSGYFTRRRNAWGDLLSKYLRDKLPHHKDTLQDPKHSFMLQLLSRELINEQVNFLSGHVFRLKQIPITESTNRTDINNTLKMLARREQELADEGKKDGLKFQFENEPAMDVDMSLVLIDQLAGLFKHGADTVKNLWIGVASYKNPHINPKKFPIIERPIRFNGLPKTINYKPCGKIKTSQRQVLRPLRLSKHNVVYYPFETKLTFRTPSQTSTWVSFPQMQDGPTYVLGREAKKVVGDWYCVDKVKKQREIDPALKESIKNALGSLNYHWIGNNINQLYGKTPDAIWELVRGILSRNPKVTSPQV